MNIANWLQAMARAGAQDPAIAVGTDVTATYAELAQRSASLAGALRGRYGLEPGERVAIVAKNDPAYLEALFGVWWAGLVAVPVNSKLHVSEVGWILEHAEASVAFVSSDLAQELGAADIPRVKELVALGGAAYDQLANGAPVPLAERAPDDTAWLFYTSGTTGRPKGAMLTHRNLAAMSLAHLAELDPTRPGDALVHAAPLSHGSGLLALPHVARRGLNVIPESGGFDPAEVAQLVNHWRRASLFAAPTMVKRMVDAPSEVDVGALRTILWGGAPMHTADTIRALERFGPCLAQIYGQGETPMTITALGTGDVAARDHPRWLERLTSAGTVRSIVEVRIAAADGRPCEVDEVGEILVRGDTVMAGYWQDAAATQAALRDGWLHTGDVGAVDAEGYLTLKDRSKDLIISGGSNVYPREVEEVLSSHPDVRETSVIGRADEEWGEIVVAYVVGSAPPEQLDELCLERIARYKRPKQYVYVTELPKNNYGKILKTELRALDAGRNAEERAGTPGGTAR